MYRLAIAAATLMALAACEVSPLEQCQTRARNQLANNARQISQSEANIARGYEYQRSEHHLGLTFCAAPTGNFRICTGTGDQVTYQRLRVDVAAEQAKLQVLRARRAEIEAAFDACTRRHPPA